MSTTSAPTPATASTTPTQDRSGSVPAEHTTLMERTREDESLGANATMSNVLYCNVNHPELKQQFPGKKLNDIVFFCSLLFYSLFISAFHYVPSCE